MNQLRSLGVIEPELICITWRSCPLIFKYLIIFMDLLQPSFNVCTSFLSHGVQNQTYFTCGLTSWFLCIIFPFINPRIRFIPLLQKIPLIPIQFVIHYNIITQSVTPHVVLIMPPPCLQTHISPHVFSTWTYWISSHWFQITYAINQDNFEL